MTTAVAIAAMFAFVYFGRRWCKRQDAMYDRAFGSPESWTLDDLMDGDDWATSHGYPVQTDAAADAEWQAILAAVGLTPAEVRAAFIDTACAQLRRDLDNWETA